MSRIFFRGNELLAIANQPNNAKNIARTILEKKLEGIKIAYSEEIITPEELLNTIP